MVDFEGKLQRKLCSSLMTLTNNLLFIQTTKEYKHKDLCKNIM